MAYTDQLTLVKAIADVPAVYSADQLRDARSYLLHERASLDRQIASLNAELNRRVK
jgi:hypothetical protein